MSVFNHVRVLNVLTERLHHTNHGLHLNKKGKNWVVNNLLKEVRNQHPAHREVSPIVLLWEDAHQIIPHQNHYTVPECQKTGSSVDSVEVNIVDEPVNEAPININIVKNQGDSLENVDSSLQINVGCVGKTSVDTDIMGDPGNEAPINVAKDQGHSSVSVDLLLITVTNKNSQKVDHVGQFSGVINNFSEDIRTRATVGQLPSVINNLQEDVTTRKSTRTKKKIHR